MFLEKQDAIRIANRNYIPLFKIFTGGKLGKLKRKIPFQSIMSKSILGLFDTVISQMLERKGLLIPLVILLKVLSSQLY
jgi:hypothetical protein